MWLKYILQLKAHFVLSKHKLLLLENNYKPFNKDPFNCINLEFLFV
jgi:hypothetical protein